MHISALIMSLQWTLQKQPSRGVLRKRCSENMHQIYRRKPMSKCDFNKVALTVAKLFVLGVLKCLWVKTLKDSELLSKHETLVHRNYINSINIHARKVDTCSYFCHSRYINYINPFARQIYRLVSI